jgi:hypothetical protein
MFVLERPTGWRWDGETWRLTADFKRHRDQATALVNSPGDSDDPDAIETATARLRGNRFGRRRFDEDAPYWSGPALPGHILPTRLECPRPHGKLVVINEIRAP